MFSSSSSLGRLFNSASVNLPYLNLKVQRNNDSVIEESVTSDLLFPEIESSYDARTHVHSSRNCESISMAAAAKSADDRGGLDIQASRDVRIIVAQKINDVHRVLSDTHPPSAYTAARTSPTPPDMNGYLSENRFGGGLGRSTGIRKARTAPHSRQTSLSQTPNGLLSSPTAPLASVTENGGLFGATKYRGITNKNASNENENKQSKMAREEREEQDEILSCMFGAPGSLSTTSTKIHVKPYTQKSPATSRPMSPETANTGSPKANDNRRSFLFRSTTAENLASLPSFASGVSEGQISRRESSYVLITRLFTLDLRGDDFHQANNSQQNGDTVPATGSNPTRRLSQSLNSGSSTKQVRTPTFAVSIVVYLSPRWQLKGALSPGYHSSSAEYASQRSPRSPRKINTDAASHHFDDRIEIVMDRLAFIVRGLEFYERTAKASLKIILADQYDGSTTNLRRALQLDPMALQHNETMQNTTQWTGKRISMALQIRPVVTGQDRWAMWKEVARGVGNISVSHEKNVFLLKLLTAFLTCHNDWLAHLTASKSKRGHKSQRKEQLQEIEAVRYRTVIVSHDKMLARRLVFLLSMFLPGNQAIIFPHIDSRLDSTPSSVAYSSSPQRSGHRYYSQTSAQKAGTRTPTFYGSDTADFAQKSSDDIHGTFTSSHYRRASDALSIRSIAMPIRAPGTRKSSVTTTATTATILPDPYHAVPHFAAYSPASSTSPSAERPGSGGSLAALSLQRTLSRTESNDHSNSSADSRGKDHWGSTRSGFWSTRRGSSTENSEVISSSAEGRDVIIHQHVKRPSSCTQTLSNKNTSFANDSLALRLPHSSTALTSSPSALPKLSPPRSIPTPSPPSDPFPLTLSFDSQDGVIDVQYSSSTSTSPTHPKATPFQSFGTTSSSHSSSRTPPHTPRHHRFTASRSSPPAVAGYLRSFHPDFALQALRPYEGLRDDVKKGMVAETSNISAANNDNDTSEKMVTLLADPAAQTLHLLGAGGYNPTSEKLTESNITASAPDPTLSAAINQILSHSSRAPSPTAFDKLPTTHSSADETKKAIFMALGKVVKEVQGEVRGDNVQRAGDSDGNGGREAVQGGEPGGDGDVTETGMLKEAVRRWIREGC